MICDLAQTYHLFDYRSYKPSLIAVLVSGLKEDSRVYKAVSGGLFISSNTLLAIIADYLAMMGWAGSKKHKQPESLVKLSLGIKEKKKEGPAAYRRYSSSKEFMKARYGGE